MNAATRQSKRVAALVANEWRLLLRNPHGLGAVFVMPALFLLVMSLTLKNSLVEKQPMPLTGWLLLDSGRAAQHWSRLWMDRNGGTVFTSPDELTRALKSERVKVGVVIQSPWLDERGMPRAEQIELWLGNNVHPAAAARLRSELVFDLVRARMEVAAAQTGPFASRMIDDVMRSDSAALMAAPVIRYLYEIESGYRMTAVQQSVPAWLVFGMFFVVIPLSGVLVQERHHGTLARLATFGIGPRTILTAKLLSFTLLNWFQLALMLAVGRWVVPLLGGDALRLDFNPGWFAATVAVTSLAAVSLSLVIAALAKTFELAAAVGGGVNVLLGAIAGIMVPRPLMPPTLQEISAGSPMGWAFDAMQSVFLGEPDPSFIVPKLALLIAFAVLCFLVGTHPLRRSRLVG
jgi:ABC-2 type transport system permease protein